MESQNQKIYLTFGTTTLRESDIDCLSNKCWLNDQIINFYFEYLTQTLIPQEMRKEILLLDPVAVTNMQYMQLDEDLEDMYGPLGLKKAKLIFIPLNDNQDQQKLRGGTHWALLVYINNEKLTQKYFLLDSSQSKGTSGMLNMANKIKKRIQYLINPDQSQDKISKESIVVLGDTPVQNNCYDCGMYVN